MLRGACLAVVAAMLLVPSGADAVPLEVDGLRHAEDAPAGPLALTPGEMLDGAGRADDPDTIPDAQRELLEQAWGGPATGWSARAAATRVAAEGEESTVRLPIRSSDVNGDGRGDAVFFEIGFDAVNVSIRAGVTALDGRTGHALWARDYGDPYDLLVLSPGDVTGDGADDLVVARVSRSITSASVPPTVARPYSTTVSFTWDLAMVDGPTGTDRWSRRIDGEVVYTGSTVGGPPMGVEATEVDATNGLFDLRRSGDDDGDGLPDLLLTRYDFSSVLLFGQLARGSHTLMAAHAQSLDGATGVPIHSRDTDRRPGGAMLRPAGDATGDGRDDLLWAVPLEIATPTTCVPQPCRSARRAGLDVELVDGASREPAWTWEVRDPEVVRAAPVISHAGDALLSQVMADGRTELFALAGRDGAERWRIDTVLSDVPTALGDDLLLWEGTEPDGLDFRLRLRRIDGDSGADLLVTHHDLTGTEELLDVLTATEVGDVDADGAPDVMIALWHFTPPWLEQGTAQTLLTVESGRDGTPLFEAERDRKALLFGGGDLRPGGPEDLLEGSTAWDDRGFLRFAAVSMPDGRTLWSRDDVLTFASFGAARGSGADGDDVIYGRTLYTGDPLRQRSRIDLLAGASGVPRWGHGDPFGDPPPPDPEPTPGSSPTPDASPAPDATPSTVDASPAPPPAVARAPAPVAAPPPRRAWVVSTRIVGRRLRVRIACTGTCRGRVVARVRIDGRIRTLRSRAYVLGPRNATVVLRLPAGRARVVRVRAA